MVKIRKAIKSETKLEILTAIRSGGYVVSDLSRLYGVSRSSIYKLSKGKAVPMPDSKVIGEAKFVELSLEAAREESPALEKASLTFSNYSILIEGKLKSSQLIAIIKLLEA